jgi:hypothetical protein
MSVTIVTRCRQRANILCWWTPSCALPAKRNLNAPRVGGIKETVARGCRHPCFFFLHESNPPSLLIHTEKLFERFEGRP